VSILLILEHTPRDEVRCLNEPRSRRIDVERHVHEAMQRSQSFSALPPVHRRLQQRFIAGLVGNHEGAMRAALSVETRQVLVESGEQLQMGSLDRVHRERRLVNDGSEIARRTTCGRSPAGQMTKHSSSQCVSAPLIDLRPGSARPPHIGGMEFEIREGSAKSPFLKTLKALGERIAVVLMEGHSSDYKVGASGVARSVSARPRRSGPRSSDSRARSYW
jgi:hypothetical protein